MYSDIIPPKKSIRKIKTSPKIVAAEKKDIAEEAEAAAETFTPYKKTYHTVSGRDEISHWPLILIVLALLILGGIVYSKYNHTTTLTFTPKTTTFNIGERISLVAADVSTKEATALPYNLVYIPAGDAADTGSSTESSRNPFVATTAKAPTLKEYTMTASTTGDVRKISFINKTSEAVSLRETTRISIGNVVYNLDKAANIPPSGKNVPATAEAGMYRVVGFKGMSEYDTVYAIAAGTQTVPAAAQPATTTPTASGTDDVAISAVPPTSIISLLPQTSLPLLKSNIYDRQLEQNAVVVIEQKDLEAVLQKVNPAMQEYAKTLSPLAGIVRYRVVIINYELEVSEDTGRPTAFRSLTIEVTPIINADAAKTTFAHFGNDAMKKIKSQTEAHVGLDISHFPFWMTDLPDADMVRVEIEEPETAIAK